MSYINVEACLAQINENRINRYNYANVYAGADKNAMTIGFAYSNTLKDEFSIVRFEEKDTELTQDLWQEILCVAKLIANKFDVELIVDDARFDSSDDTEIELETVTITYQIDKCQKRRVQRLMSIFNSMGIDFSMEDTFQAVMSSFSEQDMDKNLTFYEVMLLEAYEK